MESTKTKINTKEKIFEKAIELFSKKGCNGVSMREIAKGVGIRESSIYNHYKSKDAIIDNIFDYFAGSIKNYRPSELELNEMMDFMSPEDLFKHLVISYGRSLNGKLDSIARIIYSEQFRNEKAKKLMLEVILREPSEFIAKLIDMMMEKKLIKKVDSKLVAEEYNYALVAITFEYAHAVNNGENTAPIIKKMFNNINFICNYLRTNKIK
ncbi:TetR/AcrR family transcriptional regulator [Clostridium pasteurianum]|uniref:Transcriptional regulator n=1 Tax=Clostridium pasteurianum BC1 TaxID=86416 RepID=R4K2N1_CLOPA|nr:TetR/AcrR family transcriptional regulator [Clostridium pasteurianum]AGK95981.1 transcriptional regulator [Clostridium pasteurianum BC1]